MKVQPNRLKEVAIHILTGLNATEEEAAVVAESLIRADMRGTDTHGVAFLKLLADRVDAQMVNLPTQPENHQRRCGYRPDRRWQRAGTGRCPPGDDDGH